MISVLLHFVEIRFMAWYVVYPGFPGGSVVKNSANAGDMEDKSLLIPGLGRSLGEGNGNPLQYSCLENPMDRRVHGVVKSHTRLSS